VRRPSGGPLVVAPFLAAALALLLSYVADDWIAGIGIVVLWLIWRLLRSGPSHNEPPVLPLALSFQWVQVTLGVYYLAVTGRELEAHYASDYRPMVLIGLGCVTALTVGLALGMKFGEGFGASPKSEARYSLPWRTLLYAYIGATVGNGVLQGLAWSIPSLTQGLLAIGFVRLGILFLMFRRLMRPRPRWEWFAGFLVFELMLGFTGYFAGFREPMALAALAMLEVFRPRAPAHWIRMGVVAVLAVTCGVLWMGIRSAYRSEIDSRQLTNSRVERLGRVGELSSEWLNTDSRTLLEDVDGLVDRLWVIYYPALAVSRVPEVVPHENGAILRAALTHLVTPRILFPGKGKLVSDSDLVRKYSGVLVASTDQGTSIAFGYAAESYVDFGLPWMFVPSLLFGVFMGGAYRLVFVVIRNRELSTGLASVVFWLSLYLFERSWVRTLGMSLTLLITIGGLTFLLDRLLSRRDLRQTPPPRGHRHATLPRAAGGPRRKLA